MSTQYAPPMLDVAVPVLIVRDVLETTSYWKDVLGFPETWQWGNPPAHGGANWGSTSIQFSVANQEQKVSSTTIWIRTKNIDSLYALHQEREAKFIQRPAFKEWDFYEYMVQDLNGHNLVFAEYRPKGKAEQPQSAAQVRLVGRKPTVDEYRRLARSVGWSVVVDNADVKKIIDATIHTIVAEDPQTGEAVGCILCLGDDTHYYHPKDLIIDPKWQHRKVGSSLMMSMLEWIESRRPVNAMVSFITSENLTPFYRQFGFIPSYAMIKWVKNSPDATPNANS